MEKLELEHSRGPTSSNCVDCGSVNPSAALGGRVVGVLKSCVRFLGSLPARILEWLQSFTLTTFCTVLYLLAMYTLAKLSFFDSSTVCLSTSKVINNYQVHRLFTYAPYHSSGLHVLLNALFLSSVGKNLESKLGSYYLLNVVIIFGAICAMVQMSLEVLISYVYPGILDHCLTGFSGILFGVLILSQAVTKTKKQSILGLFFIPKGLYPWLLLAACQIVYLENISIISNLAGILTGYAYIHDLLNFVKLTPNVITALEYSELCHWVSDLPGFVHYPIGKLVVTSASRGPRHAKKKSRTVKSSDKFPLEVVVDGGPAPLPQGSQQGDHRPAPDADARFTTEPPAHTPPDSVRDVQAPPVD